MVGIAASIVFAFIAGFACAKKRKATRNGLPETVDQTNGTKTYYDASSAVADHSDQRRNHAHIENEINSHVAEAPGATWSELDGTMRPQEVA